ncbi:MAG TPA: S8 family serine peptidase, partial [Micromonosporaceae bacterium]|nr:S8 family serine peptidase [Micromonosporaceae bacterium]
MRPGRRRVAGIAAVGVVVAAVLVPRGAGSAGTAAAVTTTTTVATVATAAQAPAARGQRSTVTLITGDTVTMDGSDRIDVRRGEGRERVRFVVEHHRGHTHVIPVDALPLLRADKLDKRLFDVTALVRYGYDDRRADLPLIVAQPAGAAGARGRARPAVPAGVRVRRDLPGAGAVAARADRKDTAVWRAIKDRGTGAAVPKVWLDAKSRITLDVSVPSIGAPSAWRAGLTGEGVTVAVADTGVDGGHPDLAGKVAASRSFVSETDERDLHGHGTHVASTVAGSGAASGGRNSGVAPGARLVAAKVCDQFGFCPESAVIEGIQWAVEEQGADVVNLSLGGPDTPDLDPEEQAIERLTEQHGTLFVVAAGNSGAARTVDSPGSADAALTVGATDDGAALAPFSSQGPRVGDSALKPDITAPGVAIAAARGRDAA